MCAKEKPSASGRSDPIWVVLIVSIGRVKDLNAFYLAYLISGGRIHLLPCRSTLPNIGFSSDYDS